MEPGGREGLWRGGGESGRWLRSFHPFRGGEAEPKSPKEGPEHNVPGSQPWGRTFLDLAAVLARAWEYFASRKVCFASRISMVFS